MALASRRKRRAMSSLPLRVSLRRSVLGTTITGCSVVRWRWRRGTSAAHAEANYERPLESAIVLSPRRRAYQDFRLRCHQYPYSRFTSPCHHFGLPQRRHACLHIQDTGDDGVRPAWRNAPGKSLEPAPGVSRLGGPVGHSSRSSVQRSIERARCAGIQVATRPSSNIANTTPVNTSGSRGVA